MHEGIRVNMSFMAILSSIYDMGQGQEHYGAGAANYTPVLKSPGAAMRT